jgi:tetratricopeptide (TPR) repeat protein
VGFFNNIKKKIEVKESHVNPKTILQAEEKIPKLEKLLQENPDSYDLNYQLYCCYVDLSNSQKKVECLEKMHDIKPKEAFPLSQLAHVYYSELNNSDKGKYYQDKANKINSNKFL